ncbi:MAG TPA: hypothetical protein VHZ07_25890 [Bryobacteraceae bacterium]|jgi:hypothetical protein|nr:hypothetical protein [Bryobacteraceae bacterium]
MSTPAQIAANQANAQLSTGPKSAEGKAKSSLNAVSTGLTGRTVLLPGDEAKAFSDHMANFFVRLDPRTSEEEEIVQDLAHTKWRLNRVPQLEEDLYALGSVAFANLFEDQPEEILPGLIRAHTFVTYGKRFDNLYLQESRLTRRYQNLMRQLCDIRLKRQAEENERIAAARIAASKPPERTGRLVPVVRDSTGNGFEFANSEKTSPEASQSPDPTAPVTRSKASDSPWASSKASRPA